MTEPGRGPYLAYLFLCLSNCASPIYAPSAFDAERYLCDDEHATEFDALIESCRETHLRDQACDGVISFRAVIDSQNVVVDAPIYRATYVDVGRQNYPPYAPLPPGTLARNITLRGDAPYFSFILSLKDFIAPPGESASGIVQGSECTLTMGQCSSGEILDLEARGGNYLALLYHEIRDVQRQTPDDLRVGFTANLSLGGTVEGCFDVFPPPPPAP